MGNKPGARVAKEASAPKPEAGPHFSVVVNVIRAENVPKADPHSESDPYVVINVIHKDHAPPKEKKKTQIRTLTRVDNPNPYWNAYRRLEGATDADALRFDIYDTDDITKDDYLGSAQMDVSEITYRLGEEIYADVSLHKPKARGKRCRLYFKVLEFDAKAASSEKTLFLIRHGESIWNEAQEDLDLVEMYKTCDHPLNATGIGQCDLLNVRWQSVRDKLAGNDQQVAEALKELESYGMSREDFDAFMGMQSVYSSPLCRAAQTCLLGLLGHPCLMENGVTLMRNLREAKTLGGRDTLADTMGDRVMDRVRLKISKGVSKEKSATIHKVQSVTDDVKEKWWSEFYDDKKDLNSRFDDLVNFLRYNELQDDRICLVGHSLFFRAFVKRYIPRDDADDRKIQPIMSEEEKDIGKRQKSLDEDPDGEGVVPQNRKELLQLLGKKKLMNAGCLMLKVQFSDEFGPMQMKINDAKLLFGTMLV